MIIDEKGRVSKGFHVLGTHLVPSYLIEAPRPVLVDAGFTCLGFLYLSDIDEVLHDRSPSMLVLTHTHFDHVGAVSQLKARHPDLLICGSARSAEIVARPGAQQRIGMLNEFARAQIERMGIGELVTEPFAPFTIERILTDGEEIDLGDGLTLRVIAAPGHTRDFTSYYVPERKLLVAGEAVGCADVTGYIFTEFLSDYDDYMASLEKLASLPTDVLCQGHWYVYTGRDVQDFLARSIRSAREYRVWVERLLDEENGDVERVVTRIRAEEYDTKDPETRQPEPAYLLNVHARVEHIKSRL